jgi:3D (Asp-Asp-Asp) domain-containing protein
MLIEAVLIGTMTITSYRAVPAQTKITCKNRDSCHTSIDENVNQLGCAVSQDLLASGKIHYYDTLWIDGAGYRIVFDTMHKRIRNSIDVFVYTRDQEVKFGVKHGRVWVVAKPQNENRREERQ